MNRRRFLWQGMGCGALALGAGGFLYFQEQQRARERELALARWRAEFASRMLDDALPSLASGVKFFGSATPKMRLYGTTARGHCSLKFGSFLMSRICAGSSIGLPSLMR